VGGSPFHSFLAYVDFNVLSGKGAALFGALPASFYAQFTLGLVIWAWPGLAFGLSRRAFPESPRPWLMLVPALAYLAAIVATPHKEARFLYPAFVLLEVAALPGWLWALGLLKPRLERVALVLLSIAAGLALVPGLAPFGSGDDALSPQRAELFRLWVHAAPGATGVLQVNEGQWGSPGAFFLGRDVPWSFAYEVTEPEFQRAIASPSVNRVVTYEGRGLHHSRGRWPGGVARPLTSADGTLDGDAVHRHRAAVGQHAELDELRLPLELELQHP
jgi:GPI mannosyltransferase 3